MQTRDQTRDIFDIVSTYFVNTYWFHLYKHAYEAYEQRQFGSVEDAYKVMVDRYRIAFSAPQNAQGKENTNYIKIINDLRSQYNTWMQTTLSQGDFVDVITKQLLPEDTYKSLGRQDIRKDDVFRKTIVQAVTNFTVYASTEGLSDVTKIRDPATAKPRQQAWKEEFIQILYDLRNELYGRFMATKTGVNPGKMRNQTEQISKEAFDKMVEKIKQLIIEKAKIQKSLNTYIFAANKRMESDKARIAELEAKLEAALRSAPVRRVVAPLLPVKKEEESSGSDEDVSSEEPSDDVKSPKLERINNPDEEITEKQKNKDKAITAPLDEVPDYSGDDFVEKGPPKGASADSSDDNSSALSADE
jgi:predicted SnoaL-like aldol condensation-catalyzing enzyme